MTNPIKLISKKNKEIKEKISLKSGKVVERVFFYLIIVLFFLFIPIMFTILSTLAGAGTISMGSYKVVEILTWIISILSLFVWIYFKEFKNKE